MLRYYYLYNHQPLEKADRLPEVPAVYYAVYRGKLLYIGRAKNLQERWTTNYGHGRHHKITEWRSRGLKVEQIELYWHQRPAWRLAHDEAVAIDLFNPPDNHRREPHNWLIHAWDGLRTLSVALFFALFVYILVR